MKAVRLSNPTAAAIAVAQMSCVNIGDAVHSEYFSVQFFSDKVTACVLAARLRLSCCRCLQRPRVLFVFVTRADDPRCCRWARARPCICGQAGSRAPRSMALDRRRHCRCPAGAGKVDLNGGPLDLAANGDAPATVLVKFLPNAAVSAAVRVLLWAGTTQLGSILVTGRGGDPYGAIHTLHPVVDGPDVWVEADALDGAVVRMRACRLRPWTPPSLCAAAGSAA